MKQPGSFPTSRRAHLLAGPGAFVLALAFAACAGTDDPGGPGPNDGADTSRDLGREMGSGPDAGPDATPDAGPDAAAEVGVGDLAGDPDATEPEVTQPPCGGLFQPCCAGGTCDGTLTCDVDICVDSSDCPLEPACLVPDPGTPDVPVVTMPGEPPVLAGGVITNGMFELDRIEVYTEYTFSSLVDSVDVTSNGDTYGSLIFQGSDWGFHANLDLFIAVSALSMSFDQFFIQEIAAGGCYTVEGNELRGDLTDCGAVWPEDTTPPDALDFETTASGIKLLLILPRDAILASVPEEDRFIAGLAIVEDLPILFLFTRAQ